MKVLTKNQAKALIALLNSEDKTAYDCHVTMNTMYALVKLKLIERINWKDIIWSGWESTSVEFKLTELGQKQAKILQEKKNQEPE